MKRSTSTLTLLATLLAVSSAPAAQVCCFADLDDDGVVDGSDLGLLLADWGPGAGDGDLNGDQATDGADLGELLAAWGPCAAPANDDCGTALELSGQYVAVQFCNAAATNSPGLNSSIAACGDEGSTGFHKDLWFRYTPTHTGIIEAFTCSGASFDATMAVYAHSLENTCACPGQFAFFTSLEACADDSCGAQPFVSLPVTAGKCYTLRVGSFSAGAGGTGLLEIVNIKQGDLPELCHPLSSASIQYVLGSTAGDTAVQADPTGCAAGDLIDEWYCFTMPCQGTLTVSTCSPLTNFDTTLAIFEAGTMIPLGCSDDVPAATCTQGVEDLSSRVSISLDGGASVLIRVSGYQGASGDFELTVDADCIG